MQKKLVSVYRSLVQVPIELFILTQILNKNSSCVNDYVGNVKKGIYKVKRIRGGECDTVIGGKHEIIFVGTLSNLHVFNSCGAFDYVILHMCSIAYIRYTLGIWAPVVLRQSKFCFTTATCKTKTLEAIESEDISENEDHISTESGSGSCENASEGKVTNQRLFIEEHRKALESEYVESRTCLPRTEEA
ncbi:hypothetical protein FQA39_LY05322 [Lamprigera yunnana]|nr:hypothetical protein FQA39_LY05322 [Lamprigera yunnana]